MADIDIAKLRELANKATPGERYIGEQDGAIFAERTGADGIKLTACVGDVNMEWRDVEFTVAASPDVVLTLLDALEQARKERDDARAELEQVKAELHEANAIADSRFAWAHQVAERIATFVEADTKRWADSYITPRGFGQQLAIDIRASKWREGAE